MPAVGAPNGVLITVGALIESSPNHPLPPPAVAMLAHALSQAQLLPVCFCAKHVTDPHRNAHKVMKLAAPTAPVWQRRLPDAALRVHTLQFEFGVPRDIIHQFIDRCPHLTALNLVSEDAAATSAVATQIGARLRSLTVVQTNVPTSALRVLARQCPNLTSVEFNTDASYLDLRVFLAGCSNLTAVHLVDCTRNLLPLLGSLVGTRLRSVVLPLGRLTSDDLERFAKACPNVTSLFDGCATSDASALLCQQLPALRTLRIGVSLGAVGFAFVASPNLVSLHIQYTRVDDETLACHVRKCHSLEVLRMGAPALGDRFLCDVAPSLPRLRHLAIESSPCVTDAGLCAVARRCPHLERLSCNAMHGGITDVSLQELSRYCPHLRWVDLSQAQGWKKRGRLTRSGETAFRLALPEAELRWDGFVTGSCCCCHETTAGGD